jgi:glycine C-acetyltransferase
MAHLEQKLQLFQDRRYRLVIIEGVFSMDGNTAKLDEMVDMPPCGHNGDWMFCP